MNILSQRRWRQNVIININDVMFENALYTQVPYYSYYNKKMFSLI